MTQMQQTENSSEKRKGRPAWPYVVKSTSPNGGAIKQQGYKDVRDALAHVEMLSMIEPLNETELVARNVDGVELTLRVV